MTVWSRSDIGSIVIDQGGCGARHDRPVGDDGQPVATWALNCNGGCEDVLRSDPLWSGTPHEIPETPDETARRQDTEKRGHLEQAQSNADALAQLAKLGDLPAVLGKFMEFMASAGQLPAAPAADVVATRVTSVPALSAASDSEREPAAVGLPEDLESLSLPELRALAEGRGVPTKRSKADQIAALRDAG